MSDVISQIEGLATTYRPIKNQEDFFNRLVEAAAEIKERQKNAPKFVYDVLGRVYLYDKPEELNNLVLDEDAQKMTKVVADLLI